MSVIDSKAAVAAERSDPVLESRAAALAQHLSLRLIASSSMATDSLLLMLTSEGLELREGVEPDVRGVRVDFRTLLGRTSGRQLSRRQPLARAIGRENQTVIDATAGLGHDAALLAGIGYSVTAIERSPIVAALLADGLERALADERLRKVLRDHLRIVSGDARTILPNIEPRPDVIYIDPMYPAKRKASALANKSIRLVRQIVGDDDDAGELLAIARECAAKRVVVKRPVRAAPLGEHRTGSITSKLVRYDIHAPNRPI